MTTGAVAKSGKGHAGTEEPRTIEAAMPTDYAKMSDPAFFAARQRLREQIEELPPDHPQRAALEAELDETAYDLERRAAQAWGKAS